MVFCWLVLYCLILSVRSNNKSATIFNRNIIFGGLFPIHNRDYYGKQCGKLNIERGIHRWQAMLFAVDQINKNPKLLPNFTIKVEAHDTCQRDIVALESLVKTVIKKARGHSDQCNEANNLPRSAIGGIIGAAASSVSIEVANLLRLFRIPQISYASTSLILSDRIKYNYFTRTVPPDTRQADAIMDVVNKFNWTSVFILHSEGSYGDHGFEALMKNAQMKNICVVKHYRVTSKTNFTEIIESFKKQSSTKVVILFVWNRHIQFFLDAISLNDVKFTLIASDYWGTRKQFLVTEKLRNAADGAITLTLRSNYSFDAFQNFFCKQKPDNSSNKWLKDYWTEKYNCSVDLPDCLNQPLCNDTHFDDKIPFVIDAVYALASATDRYMKDFCVGAKCTNISSINGEEIMNNLMKYAYNGIYNNTKFDRSGSASHGYNIMTYKKGRYIQIGEWYRKKLFISTDHVDLEPSYCSQTCKIGFIRHVKENSPECCYNCLECNARQYTVNQTECHSCDYGYRPNVTRNGCEKLSVVHIDSRWFILANTLASIGILTTILVAVVFYYKRDTEIVRASAPELSFPLLFGLLLCYSMVFFIAADQTPFLCGVRRFGLGFFASICYSALLVKTNRLARVFNENRLSRRAPRFVTASSQVVIMLGLVFIEGALAMIGLYKETPTLGIVELNESTEVLFVCRVPYYDIIISYAYNGLLVIVCAIYAFQTRKVPACFNEAKYIGFVMYITVLIWLSFLLLYVIDVSVDNVVIALCINVNLNTTGVLAGLFGPKMYIILFRPSRNKRSTSVCSFSQISHSISGMDTPGSHRKMTLYSIFSETSFHPYQQNS